MKKILFPILLLTFFVCNSFSQMKASVYTNNYFGLEFNFTKKISLETRFNAENLNDSFKKETNFFYHLLQKDYYTFKLGVGLDYRLFENDPLDNLVFPFQFEIFPFEKYNYFSFVLEPTIVSKISSGVTFRNLVGLKIRL